MRLKGYYLTNKHTLSTIYNDLHSSMSLKMNSLNSSEERTNHLLLILLFSKKYLSVDDLCNKIFVGRTTLLSYIRQLKVMLKSYNLSIKTKTNIGYKIIGEEVNIRQCISEQLVEKNFDNYISQFSINERKLFSEIDLEEISKQVLFHFPAELYKISDYNRKNFVIHLAISIIRAQQEQLITTMPSSITLFDSTVHKAMSNLIHWVEENYSICYSDQDKRWLYSHLITELRHQANSEAQKQKLLSLIDQLLFQMNQSFGENLIEDTILKNDLYIHFSSYLPLQSLLKLRKNPLLQAIKKNYSYAFELTFLTISNMSVFDEYDFSEDDIAYIALHIAAAIERKEINTSSRKKVIIICGQGVSTSRLVEAIIKKRFSTEIHIIDIVSFAKFKSLNLNHVDFLIATIPIAQINLPVVQVDFLNMNKSLEQIENFLKESPQPQILETLFDSTNFISQTSQISRDSIINKICVSLKNSIDIADSFITNVLKRESVSPTNITTFIAMPHAIDKNINETKIFVCISEKPIEWQKNQSVQIIFLLAIAENDKDKLQIFFEFLSDLVDNYDLQKRISNTRSFNDLIINNKN